MFVPLVGDNPRNAGEPDDPQFVNGSQPYLAQILAPAAWDRQVGDRTVVVAVLDTGIQLDSPALARNLYVNQAEIPLAALETLLGRALVDVDGDNLFTLNDFSDFTVNAGFVFDANNSGFIEGDELLATFVPDTATGTNLGGLSDGIDQDPDPGGGTSIVDDLIGARICVCPAKPGGLPTLDNKVADDGTFIPVVFPINGHGTAVAGLIGAEGNNGATSPPGSSGDVTGVAWRVQILPIKVGDSQNAAELTATLNLGLRYARRMGAHVANLSLTFALQDPGVVGKKLALSQMFIDAYNEGLDDGAEPLLNVIAIGNEGRSCDRADVLCGPSDFGLQNAIRVASVDSADALSSFSNFGPLVADIAAPGSGILALSRTGGTTVGFQTINGSSFAAPLVAGTAALLIAQDPRLATDPATVKKLLEQNADAIPGLVNQVNMGLRLNAFNAVEAAAARP